MRAPKSKYSCAPYNAVPADRSASPKPICLRRDDRRARPAATQPTAVAAKYVTSRSVDALALNAVASSMNHHTNTHTHGAPVVARWINLSVGT